MQISAKSKRVVSNRKDADIKGNNYIMLPNKISAKNQLSIDGLNRDGFNRQNLIQKYSSKYNYELESIDSFSNNSNTARGNYTSKNEKNSIGHAINLDKDIPQIVYEKFKIRRQEINLKNCEKDEAKLKSLLKTKSFDNFVHKKHKDRMLNNYFIQTEPYRTNINPGKVEKSPYSIFSRAAVKSKTFGKEKDINSVNQYKQQRHKKENFLSTDMTFTNITNNFAHSSNNKNSNYKLLNNSNTVKKTLYPQTSFKSNLQIFDRFKILDNSIKEESTVAKDNLISEHNLITNAKHSNVNTLERKKINLTNSKPPKTPKTSSLLSCDTPNKIPTNNYYSSQKDQDILTKAVRNLNNKNFTHESSSAKKISLRKISKISGKNENETTMHNKSYQNSSGSKRNSDVKIFNTNINHISKTNSKNIFSSLITGINTTENTFQLKNRMGKTKLNDSNERSDEKKQNLFESLKLNKFSVVPKFSLNEKLMEEKLDNTATYMPRLDLNTDGNPGLNSSENDKTQTTPNLSTERTELTDNTRKAFKKVEELSPFKIYPQEGLEDNLSTGSINYKEENQLNKASKNVIQISNLEQIINNNLNYLNQNILNVSPLQDLMAKTKKFSYTDLTPLYSTNNPNKVKISQGNFKKNDENQAVNNSVEDFRQKVLNFGKNDIEKNLQDQLDNCDSTNLIHNSSDEYSSDEMIDMVNDQKHTIINNPIISRIKKNSFAVNISDEDFNFSEDEKIKITTVPVFKSKKLQYYAKETNVDRRNSIEEKMSREKLFHFIFIQNKKFKDSFVSFLSKENLLNFSFTNKLFRTMTKNILVDDIMTTILCNSDASFHIKIWKSISHHSKLSQTKFLRKEFLDNLFQKSNYEEEIRKDLLRTMPEDPTFQPGKENYKKLFNILFAYSNYNKKIGYAQGINFIIANTLYILVKEEEAFLFIDALVNKLNLNDIIGINEIAIRHKLESVGRLLEKYNPSVVKFLDKNLLNHEFFTTGWIIPLLSNSINKEFLFKFWDFLFIYGWNFFNFFIVSILCTFENKILASDPNTLSVFIKKLLKSEIFEKAFDGIIKKTFEMLKKEII